MQVIIALIVTPEGFPLAYEVLPGNTSDKTTLRSFLQCIETQYGKAQRIWVMDRGMVSAENIAWLNTSKRRYVIGTARTELRRWSKQLAEKTDWRQAKLPIIAQLS